MKPLELHPLDTLFFRDARPMEAGAGSGGHGANWPLPTVAHEALRTALLRLLPAMPKGKTVEGHMRPSHNGRRPMVNTFDFRSLHTRGPFPCKSGTLYLPCPAEVVKDDEGKAHLMAPMAEAGDRSDLSNRGLRPVLAPVRVGKDKPPPWIPRAEFVKALDGKAPVLGDEKLYSTEHRTGIEIAPETGTVVEGKLYSAEHLRLAKDVSLWMEAGLSDRKAAEENHGKTVADLTGLSVGLGGEGRIVCVTSSSVKLDIPKPVVKGTRIKWVLATHAVFIGGWRPGWLDANTLKVQLKQGDTQRRPDEDRATHRKRLAQMDGISARLVAVRNEKPIYFSGWDLGDQGPKPTLAAMPAGSVFYFEAGSEADANALVTALHGRTRSDFFGEKGMGLGYCGVWTPADVAGRPQSGADEQNQA